MCQKPYTPDNVDITESKETVNFGELFNVIESLAGDDKPLPPPNTSTTRGGEGTSKPTPPPNQDTTKGDGRK